jgi:predicted nucleic acid-binding protein
VFLDAVVADANVLLSAVVGKAALRIFAEFPLRVHVTTFNAGEVEEYLPSMAGKYGLPLDLIQLQWRLLPLIRHEEMEYSRFFKQAIKDLKDRDPEDAHALALARALGLPIWSNDRHLGKTDVAAFPTARLLRLLNLPSA